jgi:hypothetical protein
VALRLQAKGTQLQGHVGRRRGPSPPPLPALSPGLSGSVACFPVWAKAGGGWGRPSSLGSVNFLQLRPKQRLQGRDCSVAGLSVPMRGLGSPAWLPSSQSRLGPCLSLSSSACNSVSSLPLRRSLGLLSGQVPYHLLFLLWVLGWIQAAGEYQS